MGAAHPRPRPDPEPQLIGRVEELVNFVTTD
jgi:hypothetical protein